MNNKDNHQENSDASSSLPLLLGILLSSFSSSNSLDTFKMDKYLKLEARISMLEDTINQMKKII